MVIYSIDAKLGGGGIGNTAYNAVEGIYQAGLLKQLFISSNAQKTIPLSLIHQWGILGRGLKYLGSKDKSGLIYYLNSLAFDGWVTPQLSSGNIFHCWHGHALWGMRKAKQKGMITVIERASSHPNTVAKLLNEEYQRWQIPFSLQSWNYSRLMREIEEADYITTPSPFARESMIAEGVPEHKLIEIPFGVNANQFPTKQNLAPHPFRVIFAGQVSIRKGIPYLLEAWRQLQWPDAELWVVGGIGLDFKTLQSRWANLSGVKFWGHSANLPELFQQSDIFVFPTIEEGSALVVYEAMACGLPVITTFNAGSVARHGQDGFIVPIRNVESLCHAMQLLRDTPQLRTHMGQSAQAWVSQFTWQRYQEQLVKAYHTITTKH